jgi:hypothetical protein
MAIHRFLLWLPLLATACFAPEAKTPSESDTDPTESSTSDTDAPTSTSDTDGIDDTAGPTTGPTDGTDTAGCEPGIFDASSWDQACWQ